MANQCTFAGPDRSLTVLIVEDQRLIAMDLEMLLEESGYRVVGPATTTSEALRLLSEAEPDVAVLDADIGGQLVTPVADELLRRHIPFILSSAYTSFKDAGSRVLAEATNVGKPFNERRLLAALADVIGS